MEPLRCWFLLTLIVFTAQWNIPAVILILILHCATHCMFSWHDMTS